MKRTFVLDFFGIVRIIGYSLAIMATLIAVALYLLGFLAPFVRFLAVPVAGQILLGLAVAWIAGLSRLFVRRMHFASPQD